MFIMLLPGIFFVLLVNIVKHVMHNGLEFETKQVITEVVEWAMLFLGVMLSLWIVLSPAAAGYGYDMTTRDSFVVNEIIGAITSVVVILFRSFTLVSKK